MVSLEFLHPTCTDNPAVLAVSELVEVLQGDSAVLEVYASSYPLVMGEHIRWYWPNSSQISEGGVEFMSDGRALFLVNVQSSDAGAYRCEVTVPSTSSRASVTVQLNVYGMC